MIEGKAAMAAHFAELLAYWAARKPFDASRRRRANRPDDRAYPKA
jgi:hypothetical protein